ncbi:hypothetical protein [Amycolatopsis sp. YIM 10]|uniref:hypothetical protein n=1 Tax=Amycolatopsis sp. YIM 10 TaxID=2653857 RepID=UPI0012901E15|nr:hypothetical protein [Amycolatopsis sp. YIM 10]
MPTSTTTPEAVRVGVDDLLERDLNVSPATGIAGVLGRRPRRAIRTVAAAERSGEVTIAGDRDTAELLLHSSQHSRKSASCIKHDGAVT